MPHLNRYLRRHDSELGDYWVCRSCDACFRNDDVEAVFRHHCPELEPAPPCWSDLVIVSIIALVVGLVIGVGGMQLVIWLGVL